MLHLVSEDSNGNDSNSGRNGADGNDNAEGGVNGNGGKSSNITTGGGAGFSGNGEIKDSGFDHQDCAKSFVSGGLGGITNWDSGSVEPAQGGFGGGGGVNRNSSSFKGAGGGGGYSGGGSSYRGSPSGGGGGSYNSEPIRTIPQE